MEQRVVFGIDSDRWWGGLQDPNWPPPVVESSRRRAPPGRCCRCRPSRWTLLWVPLSFALVALSLYVAVAPYWIIRRDDAGEGANTTSRSSLGLFRRCLSSDQQPCRTFSAGHLLEWHRLPGLWVTAACVSSLAVLMALVSAGASLLSCCSRFCGCVNIFKTAGTLNILTVLCHVVAAVVYPMDWGADIVRDMCGDKAQAFVLGKCTIGWCIYALMLTTVLNLACAALAMKIDSSTPEYVEYGGVKS